MPSEIGSAPSEPSQTRRDRRSLRAATPAAPIPRPLRYAVGVGALVVVLAGSLSFANAAGGGNGAGGSSDVADLAGRDDVWAQVSRGDSYREPLALEAGEAVTFTVTVDGRTVDLTSTSTTILADALIDAGIVVDLDDIVSAPMGQPAGDGAQIAVERVGTQLEADVTTLPFETIEQKTSRLPTGTTQVETEGVEGSKVTTYQTTYSDGEAVDRVELNAVVASQPVDKVVLVGTGPVPSAGSGSSGSGSSGSSGSTTPPPTTYTGGDPRAIAQQMLASYGWGSDQWGCLDSLWQRESGWNPYAQNPSSGAYGIPQALPGSKMGTAGSDWRTNPATQIKWGLSYIQGRYGTPCGAWSHSQSVGWY